jgi:hypothetical protein
MAIARKLWEYLNRYIYLPLSPIPNASVAFSRED